MNKTNNCLSGCNTHSNEIKILIKRLENELKNYKNDTTATLLLHDGKIAELCNYLKINLSNSIRDLLDSMILSGELTEIITNLLTDELNSNTINSINQSNLKEVSGL